MSRISCAQHNHNTEICENGQIVCVPFWDCASNIHITFISNYSLILCMRCHLLKRPNGTCKRFAWLMFSPITWAFANIAMSAHKHCWRNCALLNCCECRTFSAYAEKQQTLNEFGFFFPFSIHEQRDKYCFLRLLHQLSSISHRMNAYLYLNLLITLSLFRSIHIFICVEEEDEQKKQKKIKFTRCSNQQTFNKCTK